jgi:hypothetical protein
MTLGPAVTSHPLDGDAWMFTRWENQAFNVAAM